MPEEETADGDYVQVGTQKKLFVTSGEMDRLREHAVYFIRMNTKGIGEKTVEQDMAAGEVRGSVLVGCCKLQPAMHAPYASSVLSSTYYVTEEEGQAARRR